MKSHLGNKTALVTGASRGIGRATALALARQDTYVLVHYSTAAAEAEAVVADIRAAGGRADALSADLGTADGPHALAAAVREALDGRLDILVANAGIAMNASIDDMAIDDFDRLFAINVRAPYFLTQQLLPLMGEGASIVLLSSLGARSPVGEISAYAATKGAIDTLVKHFAQALGSRGIRVNGVAPGVVDTDMSAFVRSEAGREQVFKLQALQRVAQPEDIADVIAFLASDGARWITGDIVQVDGGTKL